MIKEILWFLMLCTSLSCANQRCLSCKMVPTPIDCQTVTQCGPNQECYAKQYVTHAGIKLYDVGCIDKLMCSTTVGVLPSGFGKRNGNKTPLHKRQTSHLCTECCNNKDLCNMNGLCGSQNIALPSGSTLCYNCKETRQLEDCHDITLCNNHQVCQVHSTTNTQGEVRWHHGCVQKQQCPDLTLPDNSCQTCCTSDLCNTNCTPSTATDTQISTKSTTVKQTTSTLRATTGATTLKHKISVSSNQRCLSCTMVQTPYDCHTVSQCALDEECYTKKYVTHNGSTWYDLGCINRSMCFISVGLLPSGFGKRNGDGKSLRIRQATSDCTECCDDKDLCNMDGLCGYKHQTPSSGYTLCYNCSDLGHIHDCHNISLCDNNQVCQVHSTRSIHGGVQWKQGCVAKQQCPDSSLPTESCQTCCATDLCNDKCTQRTQTSHMAINSLPTTPSTTQTTITTTLTTLIPLTKPQVVRINIQPAQFHYGSTLKITCEATGNPAPHFEFMYRGIPQTNTLVVGNTISIRNFNELNNGDYRCIVTNKLGQDTKTVYLHGQGSKPIVQIHKSPNITHYGSTVKITCDASGSPTPNIDLWFKSASLPVNTKVIGNVITIRNFTTFNNGYYKCIAKNEAGNDSKTIHLEGPGIKPTILKISIIPQDYQIGDNVNITCIATGYPKPEINFSILATHHAYGIPSNDKVIGNTIFINNITFSNVKRYKCMASNTFGRDEQQFQLQDPKSKPSIVMISIQPQIYYVGDTVNVTCKATGNPKPNITYMVMTSFGKPSNVKVHDNSIIISDFTSENIGMYRCEASNTFGRDGRIFKLQPSQVTLPSNISIEINPTHVTYGRTIHITCQASGEPKPDIYFQSKIDSNVPGNVNSQGHTLIIANFSVANNGDYRCVASNLAGNSSKLVRVEGPRFCPSKYNGWSRWDHYT
ncbi:uncharacterized protein LOC143052540 isoform X2 [Mytilus galloprovincialis]|uniref:uncharacterized protein LOC143052540 isoform X2 n=1 Tax=Mytilus galloprovincialis TaxID=29158 RepID=UPI003F7BC99C